MTTTIRPTRQALRMHMSHLATTHRAPLVNRTSSAARTTGADRPRATAFTPMAPEGGAHEKPRHQIHTQIQSQLHES
jgi:hypothetical protein